MQNKKLKPEQSLSKIKDAKSKPLTKTQPNMDGEDFLADTPNKGKISKPTNKTLDGEKFLSTKEKKIKSFESFVHEDYYFEDETDDETDDDNYKLVVDLDERGEYNATVYGPSEEIVYSIDTQLMRELIEDGYLKYVAHEDLDGLTNYLIKIGLIPEGSEIVNEKLNSETHTKLFNSFINEYYEENKPEYQSTPTPEDFTFKTDAELNKAKAETNFIPSYKIVRIEREMPDGSTLDYPCETFEDYEKDMKRTDGEVKTVYPSDHMYEFEID